MPSSIRSVPEFLAWTRSNANQATYGTAGNGTSMHFVGILLTRASQTQLRHIPYRGSQPAIQDLIGGQLSSVIAPLPELATHVAAGKCRLLATTGATRSKFFPSVPTLIEQGFADLESTEWHGFFVPAKTPADVVQRLNAAIQAAAGQSDLVDAMATFAFEVTSSSSAELASQLARDTQRWGRIIQSIGYSPED